MKRSVVILGAGIAGLTLGYYLKKQYGDALAISILEKSDRTGGWIQTIQKDGFLFELGPRSCRPKGAGAATLKLIEELGLQNEVLPGHTDARYRYLYYKGNLQPFPTNPFTFCTSPLTRDLIPSLVKEWWCPKNDAPDETIEGFISRRFGKKMAHRLIDPMATGIYAGDITKLSMRSCFPKLWKWEREHGSIIRGLFHSKSKESYSPFITQMQKHALFSFKNGMQTLSDALAKHLQNEIFLNTEVKGLHFQENHVDVVTKQNTLLQADHVFSTLPAHHIATMIPSVENQLTGIPFNSITVVNVGYRSSVLKKKGFGYLIPSSEKEEILGVVWDSCVFPDQNRTTEETRLTVMMKGTDTGVALKALKDHLKITHQPDTIHVHVAKQAIPQYQLGHNQRVQELKRLCPENLTLLGNSYEGIAVNEIIKSLQIIALETTFK